MIKSDRCPICGSGNIKTIYQSGVIGNSPNNYSAVVGSNPVIKKYVRKTYRVTVMHCIECSHAFQYDIFSPEEELEYHQSYLVNDNSWISDHYQNVDALVEEVKEIRNITPFKTVLDIGASHGEFCFLLKALHATPTAFDLCTKTNKYLSDNGIECFSSIDHIDRKFDVVRVSHVLSHIQNDVYSFVKDLVNLVNTNGVIYFIDHKLDADLYTIRSPLLHTNVFSEESISLLIPDCLVKVGDFSSQDSIFKCYRRKCV
jgi:2-polyprenyl-3-methyl-5-hydroxy-6-metoxy-1,4-benzoquinol methylase